MACFPSNYWNNKQLKERYNKNNPKAHKYLEEGMKSAISTHVPKYDDSKIDDGEIDSYLLDEHGNIILGLELENSTNPYDDFWIRTTKFSTNHYLNMNPKSLLIRFFKDGEYCAIVSFDVFYKHATPVRYDRTEDKPINNLSCPTNSKFIFFVKTEDLGKLFDFYAKTGKFNMNIAKYYEDF